MTVKYLSTFMFTLQHNEQCIVTSYTFLILIFRYDRTLMFEVILFVSTDSTNLANMVDWTEITVQYLIAKHKQVWNFMFFHYFHGQSSYQHSSLC